MLLNHIVVMLKKSLLIILLNILLIIIVECRRRNNVIYEINNITNGGRIFTEETLGRGGRRYERRKQINEQRQIQVASFIKFYYFKNGEQTLVTSVEDTLNAFTLSKCDRNDKFAILVHGWQESCQQKWMELLILNLTKYRGGCIICMDYNVFAVEPYPRLMRHFGAITNILTQQLILMEALGFIAENGYMFGFSYGGQIVCEAGRRFGPQKLKEIDTCDMAGPGFDFRPQPDHKLAAQNVQCIHTSANKGTRYTSNCNQDWKMGNCGESQPAASEPPFGSHGLCPYFYVSAFENDFYAIERPTICPTINPAQAWPPKFKMGYMENRKIQVTGELFAYTGLVAPFNVYENIPTINLTTDFEYDYDNWQ